MISLPGLLLQCIQCPTPFIIGCNKELLSEEILEELGEEVLVVDLDKSQVVQGAIPCQLPPRLLNSLYERIHENLKKSVVKCDSIFYDGFNDVNVFPDLNLRFAFYETLIEMLGHFGFHRYVWIDELSLTKAYLFDEASYLASSSAGARPFRSAFAATQAFSEFICCFNGFVQASEEVIITP